LSCDAGDGFGWHDGASFLSIADGQHRQKLRLATNALTFINSTAFLSATI
jgi:hypothetical protein